jgi:hypothetical protein
MSAFVGNAPVAPSTVRAPRAQVLINGNVMQGVVGISVTLNNNFQAGQFTIDANVEPSYVMNENFWSQQTKVTAEIQIGYLTGGSVNWVTVLSGIVDAYDINFDNRGITVTGRDLAGMLIDTKTANTFSNQTSSEIATMLAKSVGLTPVVTPTTTPVGRYYQIDHAKLSLGQFHSDMTEWDLLIYLAQQEGFDLFVSGTSLFFQPAATTQNAYNISWQLGTDDIPISNVINLTGHHSLTLAKGVSVTVKSWHSGLKRPIIAKTADPNFKDTGDDGGQQNFVFYVPNLTPQQAISLANQRYADITRHLREIQFDAPGDLVLSPRMVVVLSGTGTSFDTTYYPDTIELQLSQQGGFTMSVTAKNIPPTPNQLI